MATAALLIAALVAALFYLPATVLAGLIGILLILAALEWARLCRLAPVNTWVYAVTLALVFAALRYLHLETEIFALAALFWIIIAPLWMWRGVRAEQAAWIGAAGFAVLVPAGLAILALAPLEALLVLVLVWIADSAAYFVGRAWGRRKLAPSISPGKSWEGAIGGVIAAAGYAIILGYWMNRMTSFLGAAVLLAIVSIVGDLFESAAKRQAGAKDSGTLLPGHGGILDRIDSATAVLPLAALLWPAIR